MPTTQSAPIPSTHEQSAQKAIQYLNFLTLLVIAPMLQGFIVLWAGLPLHPRREHLIELFSCWVGFTATIWIIFLLGTLSAYKAGSYVSACRAILVVFIVAAEPFIAHCIWGDQYLTALRKTNVVSVVICSAGVLRLQRNILLGFYTLYNGMTSDAAISRDGPLGGQEIASVYGTGTGREQVDTEK